MPTRVAASSSYGSPGFEASSSPLLPNNALGDPLLDSEEGGGDSDIHRQLALQEKNRCCCFRGSKSRILFTLAVLGVVAGVLLFVYFVLLRLFVETALNSASINVTLMRVGAPVSPTQAPISAALSAELDVPNLNYTVKFSDSTLGYYSPGVSPDDANAAPIIIGSLGSVQNSHITVEPNSSKALLNVQGLLTVTDASAFGQFGHVILEQPNITADLASQLEIDVVLWGMTFKVHDVKMHRALTFNALDNLPNVSLTVFTATMATDGTRRVIVSATILLGNPTIVAIQSLGNVSIELFFEGSSLGIFEAMEPTLGQGSNMLQVVGPLVPDNMTALNGMLSSFLSGLPAPLVARGRTSSYPLFDGLIGGLVIGANLTSKNSGFLESALVNVTLAQIRQILKTGVFSFPVSVKLLNPFECPIRVRSLDLFVTYQNQSVGYFNNTLDISIPGGAQSRTPYVNVSATKGLWLARARFKRRRPGVQ
eukprot:INCI4255.2.p1 GENE.INCI4255.2~~INCI4255.2.p1  ORF type:complete len:481 (-),score=72.17 INCI4255.2:767-2209(-)